MAAVSREAWLKALHEVVPTEEQNDADALTSTELGEIFGVSRTATQHRIRKLMAAGRIKQTTKIIVDSAGRTQRIVAYLLVEDDTNPETAYEAACRNFKP